ncbi:ESAT-6-like protein [Mycobacteroides stephanolepidis]|uniref:ESAT-6-like protein n=1 Tax=[Mycobacterium] stephanolepidis TaxID=1520670 RepID=A0A1Z4F1W8_9MYCO|nr:WXG100 family type VII secretion target [[Mycobacterium] stephanolepidis]BAX99201.1 ESAT-6-like protein [[Mycobacterium] stephanolepidis]
MASVFQNDLGLLDATSKKIQNKHQEFAAIQNQLRDRVAVGTSTWQGSARRAFDEAMARFDQEMGDIQKVLLQISDTMESNKRRIQEMDEGQTF